MDLEAIIEEASYQYAKVDVNPNSAARGFRAGINWLLNEYKGDIAVCQSCYQFFQVTRHNQKFCSHKCAARIRQRRWRDRKHEQNAAASTRF